MSPPARWNEYLAVDDDDTDVITYHGGATSAEYFRAGPTGTPLMRSAFANVTSALLPLGIAAAFLAPAPDIRRRVRLSSATHAPFVVFDQIFEDDWTLVRELVTRDQIDELQRLWALPYPGPVSFDFRAPE